MFNSHITAALSEARIADLRRTRTERTRSVPVGRRRRAEASGRAPIQPGLRVLRVRQA